MPKSRYLHIPPNPKSYLASEIWTEDGKKLHGLLTVLFKLKVISLKSFDHLR